MQLEIFVELEETKTAIHDLVLNDDVEAVRALLYSKMPKRRVRCAVRWVMSLEMANLLFGNHRVLRTFYYFHQPRFIRELVACHPQVLRTCQDLVRSWILWSPIATLETWLDVGFSIEWFRDVFEFACLQMDMDKLADICALAPSSFLSSLEIGLRFPQQSRALLLMELGFPVVGQHIHWVYSKFQANVAERQAVLQACLFWINFVG